MSDMVTKSRSSHGEGRWNTFFTDQQIAKIRNMASNGTSVKEIADCFGAKYHTIYQIVKNKRWIEKA